MGGMVIAALLLIVGGLRESIQLGSRTIRWNALIGGAYLLLAVGFVLPTLQPALTGGGTSAWIMFGVAVIGGGSLVWLGVQTARDTRHVDLNAEPSNTRLVGVALLAVGSFFAGIAVWSFVL
jgi:hypothetical protein